MQKRKIMNYHQNTVDRVIAAQILADRAGLNDNQKKALVKNIEVERNKSLKKEKFIKLGNKRVKKTMASIKLISNLANLKNYSYSEKDANQILKLLDSEIKKLKFKFKKSFK